MYAHQTQSFPAGHTYRVRGAPVSALCRIAAARGVGAGAAAKLWSERVFIWVESRNGCARAPSSRPPPSFNYKPFSPERPPPFQLKRGGLSGMCRGLRGLGNEIIVLCACLLLCSPPYQDCGGKRWSRCNDELLGNTSQLSISNQPLQHTNTHSHKAPTRLRKAE